MVFALTYCSKCNNHRAPAHKHFADRAEATIHNSKISLVYVRLNPPYVQQTLSRICRDYCLQAPPPDYIHLHAETRFTNSGCVPKEDPLSIIIKSGLV